MWREAADELSVELEQLPYGFHEARFGDRVVRIQDHLVPLDYHLTLMLARNKPLVHELLSQHGIHVPPFHAFRMDELETAKQFLESQDGPCVVKPALGSAGGEGVTTQITTPRELRNAAIFASIYSPLIMVERQITGDVHRLLYLDGELIDAIHRRPPRVVGDGRRTIRQLIRAENGQRVAHAGSGSLKNLVIDFDCRATLRGAGLSLNTVPPSGQEVIVKTATNESAAHECESIGNNVHEDVIREGAKAAEVLGVRLAGLDVISPDIRLPLRQNGGAIIEVNASPGLQYHYQVRNQRVPVAVAVLARLLDIPHVPVTGTPAVME